MGVSKEFELLHKDIQRWIWEQRWTDLRDIQRRSIVPILAADRDIIISASTASGKTEAAFLPACSRIASLSTKTIGILYISPLKALINDQHRRLERISEITDIPVTSWHGDANQVGKKNIVKNPRGIILITPESLESLLLNHGNWIIEAFDGLSYIIIDEFHAFLGTERGRQLQSLMHRIDVLLKRKVPRVALSATIGDIDQVASYLRPNNNQYPCEKIVSQTSRHDLKVSLKGYVDRKNDDERMPSTFGQVAEDIYKRLRGGSHLVFANSRRRTEQIAAFLSDKCQQEGVPNEFFPHHGNLSKTDRESLEARLQSGVLPTTAICTMTLELGIDIGKIDSIAQVTAPYSVASLRQRLGRSGRRGGSAILRMYIEENEISPDTHLLDQLRMETFQSIAVINLLISKRYEPAPNDQFHFSTLIQQTLSVIGQHGGIKPNQLWSLLCDSGPFHLVDRSTFQKFLKGLGHYDLIMQTEDGQIILGVKGDELVKDYSFFAAFDNPGEYRIEYKGQLIGTLPCTAIIHGKQIAFAGQYWKIKNIDFDGTITVDRSTFGVPPRFESSDLFTHDMVRQEVFRLYETKIPPSYLDKTAKLLFEEGVEYFHKMGLGTTKVLQSGGNVLLLLWMGDRVTNTLSAILRLKGLNAESLGPVIEISGCTTEEVKGKLKELLSRPRPTPLELAKATHEVCVEKHDRYLPIEIRVLGYGAKMFDVDGAMGWVSGLF